MRCVGFDSHALPPLIIITITSITYSHYHVDVQEAHQAPFLFVLMKLCSGRVRYLEPSVTSHLYCRII
jgi:hypothetical protein